MPLPPWSSSFLLQRPSELHVDYCTTISPPVYVIDISCVFELLKGRGSSSLIMLQSDGLVVCSTAVECGQCLHFPSISCAGGAPALYEGEHIITIQCHVDTH